jgi:hypothetical protein
MIIAAALALNVGHPGMAFKSSGILHPDGPNIKMDGLAHCRFCFSRRGE